MGKDEKTTKNENVKEIIKFRVENDLVIDNSKFACKKINKITREEHSGKEKSVIWFLINIYIWGRVKDVKVRGGIKTGSCHNLLRLELK